MEKTPIDIEDLLARVSGNREFVIRMLDLFFGSSDDRLAILDTEYGRRNYHELAEQAHKLKGLTGNLSITGAPEILKDLHDAAVAGRGSEIAPLLERLRETIEQARLFFRENPDLTQ